MTWQFWTDMMPIRQWPRQDKTRAYAWQPNPAGLQARSNRFIILKTHNWGSSSLRQL